MKIGLVIYGHLGILSGGYLYDRLLVEHLEQRGHEVLVFSQTWGNYWHRLKQNVDHTLVSHIANAALDLLLQDELNHPSLFWLNRTLRQSLACPIITIVHHLLSSEHHQAWRNLLYGPIERRYLQSVDGFIFNSETTRQVVTDLVGNQQPGVVAQPGKDNLRFDIDPDSVQKRARQTRPLHLVFVGNIIPRKSLHLLIRALARLPANTWQLTVIGDCTVDTAYFAEVSALVSQFNVSPAIRFLGKVAQADLVAALIDGDVLAVPSSYEGFGIVYVEAMGAGLPVLAGNEGGAAEIVADGKSGFLVTQDEADIANKIGLLIDDRTRLAQMSVAALERYQSFPTWSQSLTRITAFLEEFETQVKKT